jgi:drug/metabolite transporter (DMT)-like permease
MWLGVAAGLAAGALWGLVFVAPRMVQDVSAVDFTAGRFVSYGALSLLLMLLMRKSAWPTRQQALAAAGMSVLGFTGYYLLLVLAIRDAGTEVPSLIIGTIPIWMMILGKPTELRWAGLVPGLLLTLGGLALMVYASHSGLAVLPTGGFFWRGVLFALCSMAFWTVFGIYNSRWLKRHLEVDATMWCVAGTDAKVLLVQANIAQAAILSVATGIGSAWLATILWNIASQRLSASLCGQMIVSETIFALVYSFIWDGHWPSAVQLAACVLFIAGILASIRAHR